MSQPFSFDDRSWTDPRFRFLNGMLLCQLKLELEIIKPCVSN